MIFSNSKITKENIEIDKIYITPSITIHINMKNVAMNNVFRENNTMTINFIPSLYYNFEENKINLNNKIEPLKLRENPTDELLHILVPWTKEYEYIYKKDKNQLNIYENNSYNEDNFIDSEINDNTIKMIINDFYKFNNIIKDKLINDEFFKENCILNSNNNNEINYIGNLFENVTIENDEDIYKFIKNNY